jgi:hypothetical protein
MTECDGNVEDEEDHSDNLEEEQHLDDNFDVDDTLIYCVLHLCDTGGARRPWSLN